MYRRISVIAALMFATVVAAWAAPERATFVLSNGERKSGAVVYHGDKGENLINGFLNLSNDAGGPEFTVPISQVVVIDFTGGKPGTDEKKAVPTDSSQLLALKNGQTKKGKFVNMIGGDTLVWERDGGGEERHMLVNVARIYLNGRQAWTTYIQEEPPMASAGQSSNTAAAKEPGTVTVSAKEAWTDTGITLRRGERYVFRASGEVKLVADAAAGPDGRPGMRGDDYPLPQSLGGALIARIGNSKPFLIGSNSKPILIPLNGRLYLGVNDKELADNSGEFTVKIEKQ